MNQVEKPKSSSPAISSLVFRIKSLAASERKITAEVVDCIRVIETQKIHLAMGYSSLLEFLVQECGYSETSALRRIDAARLLKILPEVRVELQNGNLNLSQVSLVAQSVRQKEKLGGKVSFDKKKELVEAVKHKKSYEVQRITAQMLDLPILRNEKKRVQADESVRIELSLSKEEMLILNRAKEILGHVKPGMNIKELVVLLAERFVKAKDPAREVRLGKGSSTRPLNDNNQGVAVVENSAEKYDDTALSSNGTDKNQAPGLGRSASKKTPSQEFICYAKISEEKRNLEVTKISEDKRSQEFAKSSEKKRDEEFTKSSKSAPVPVRSRVTAGARRFVFQRDRVCQWIDPLTKRKCGSRHLLEVDHRVPKWAGGGDGVENLEIKCRAHNRWKYCGESGIQSVAVIL